MQAVVVPPCCVFDLFKYSEFEMPNSEFLLTNFAHSGTNSCEAVFSIVVCQIAAGTIRYVCESNIDYNTDYLLIQIDHFEARLVNVRLA